MCYSVGNNASQRRKEEEREGGILQGEGGERERTQQEKPVNHCYNVHVKHDNYMYSATSVVCTSRAMMPMEGYQTSEMFLITELLMLYFFPDVSS